MLICLLVGRSVSACVVHAVCFLRLIPGIIGGVFQCGSSVGHGRGMTSACGWCVAGDCWQLPTSIYYYWSWWVRSCSQESLCGCHARAMMCGAVQGFCVRQARYNNDVVESAATTTSLLVARCTHVSEQRGTLEQIGEAGLFARVGHGVVRCIARRCAFRHPVDEAARAIVCWQ